MRSIMLTTVDNPFNPFTQFDEWYAFDIQHFYNTLGLVARFASFSEDLSDDELEAENQNAIARILAIDFEHKYKIVEEPIEAS